MALFSGLTEYLSGPTKYLLDANAVRELSYDSIKAKQKEGKLLFTIPSVRYETAGLDKSGLLSEDSIPPLAYDKMAEIIKHEKVISLIDYYNNEGAADVEILAYALTAGEGFLKDEIVVVTNDKGLREACAAFSVSCISVGDFKAI